MSDKNFTTPRTTPSYSLGTRSSALKRDSLAAELERDPQLSTAKRQQRKHVLTSSMAQASLERQIVSLQTAKLELEAQLREKDATIHALERDRRWLADREQEEREAKEKERTEFDMQKTKLDSELRETKATLSALREELAEIESDYSNVIHESQNLQSQLKMQLSTFERRAFQLEEQLQQSSTLADERLSALHQLQERYDELETKQDSIVRQNSEKESMDTVREELHRQAKYMRSLENANAKLTREVGHLRERSHNMEILKEEKRGLERKAAELEEMRERVVQLEAEVEAGRKERDAWALRSQGEESASAVPVTVTQSLKKLRIEHAELLEKAGATSALLHHREAELSQLRQQCQSLEARLEEREAEIRTEKDKTERALRKLTLVEREVGFQRALVASFQAEAAVQNDETTTDPRNARITQLEALLAEYKTSNTQLAQELDRLKVNSTSTPARPRVEALLKELDAQRAKTKEVEQALQEAQSTSQEYVNKIEELEQSLFELSGEIAGGRHAPPGVRILKMREEPDQEWIDLRKDVLEKLKGENEALLRRLKELEESGVTSTTNQTGGDLVPRESLEAIAREKADLEDLVKQKEKRLVRLQEVFKSKSHEFREAVTSILGVKLAFYPNGDVRVTSVYDLNASFVFKSGAAASMQLVATAEDLPENLPETMEHWIVDKQCIPGFIASVTLECIDKSERTL